MFSEGGGGVSFGIMKKLRALLKSIARPHMISKMIFALKNTPRPLKAGLFKCPLCALRDHFINTSFFCAVKSSALITYKYTPLATHAPRSSVASHMKL